MRTQKITFHEAGVALVADVAGPVGGRPVIFLHGGGQTRGSWKGAMAAVAARGFRAVCLDQRGHGESGWAEDGDYGLDRFVDDLEAVCSTFAAPPVLVGASLGGLAAMLAIGDRGLNAAALILVDVTPRLEPEGVERIRAFMRSAPEGFASIEEAADAVAAYLPHRPRPKDSSGLARNLRWRANGRLHWHWDPRFMDGGRSAGMDFGRLEAAGRALDLPTLLVRGGRSEIVSPEGARAFLELAPHAEFVDVADADHMVAGDANDAFNAAVIEFILRKLGPGA